MEENIFGKTGFALMMFSFDEVNILKKSLQRHNFKVALDLDAINYFHMF